MSNRIKNVPDGLPDPDIALIKRAMDGNTAAFNELVTLYQTRVASVAYQMVGNYEDARDVSQEVFIKLHKNIHRFNTKMKFFTWLYRLTVNASIDFIRSRKRRQQDSSIDEVSDQYLELPEGESTDNLAEKQELRDIFLSLANKLNEKQRAAFILSDIQGFSADEVADILDCPKTTLRWYLHQARKSIRTEIMQKYPEYWRGKWK
ncbi:RNA polymerase sigma factor [Calditrichota bacterium]